MSGRQLLLLSSLFILALSPTAFATNHPSSKTNASDNKSEETSEFDFNLAPDYYYYYYAPATSWADSVTMTSLPPGSLIVDYNGPQELIIKHARSQVRRYTRRYRQYSEAPSYDVDVWNNAPDLNAWWTRSWMASLPPEQGGAPAQPYVHTIGKELTWSYGPFTISNTLKLKIDYLAVFKFNPDPGENTGDANPPLASVDVRSVEPASFGSRFRLNVRPSVQVGLPRSDGWLSALRSIAIRAEFDIIIFDVRLARGDVVLEYKPDAEFSLQVGVTIGVW